MELQDGISKDITKCQPTYLYAAMEALGMLGEKDHELAQMSGHIFAPNGGYCLYYPSSIFRNKRSFENWGISSDIPQFYLGNIRSRDALRPIAREQRYLMDCTS